MFPLRLDRIISVGDHPRAEVGQGGTCRRLDTAESLMITSWEVWREEPWRPGPSRRCSPSIPAPTTTPRAPRA